MYGDLFVEEMNPRVAVIANCKQNIALIES
jgi:hypothetical protein